MFYKRGQYAALVKLALQPGVKKFLQRAAVGAGTGAAIGYAIAPRKEDRPRMALYSGLADLPILGISHAPDLIQHLRETRPGFAKFIENVKSIRPSTLFRRMPK